MNVVINRLDPLVPDPVESRRRAAGRFVRIAYALSVFGVLAFFIVYFGAPYVFLRGPGVISSPRYVISLPYIVHVSRINVVPGAAVKLGEEIAQVRSPRMDGIVGTYMNALADITGRRADLRIKARVALDSIDAARAYLRQTEEAVERLDGTAAGSLTLRLEFYRERASARKALVTHEAEAEESTAQLATLDEFEKQLRARLDEIERDFAQGRVLSPMPGIVSTGLAHVGQSLVAGAPIAEILDPTDIFVDWYIPNERLVDPKVGKEVLILFGNRRIPGKIAEILPVSDVFAKAQPLLAGDRPSTQIARIRFSPGALPPALNSTVYVHMHYSEFSDRGAEGLIRFFGAY
jgi:HlyD family secretion protein